MNRSCACGMPSASGIPWLDWHRLHERQHAHAYPELDGRSRRNLAQLSTTLQHPVHTITSTPTDTGAP